MHLVASSHPNSYLKHLMKVEYCNLLATIATDTTAVDTAIIKTAADLKISWRSYENLARLNDLKNLFI